MIIELNKDFLKEYKDNAWKGFSTKELLCIIVAVIVAVIIDVCVFTYTSLDAATGIYIAFPFALPVIVWGFYKYQGFLSLSELIKELMYCNKTAVLDYDSGEASKDVLKVYDTALVFPEEKTKKNKEPKKIKIMYVSNRYIKKIQRRKRRAEKRARKESMKQGIAR